MRSNYIVITPAKDERQHIERTIASMLNQSVRPRQWIIVDDGSQDGTSEIIERAAKSCDWITAVMIRRDAERLPGSAEIRAFYVGYEHIQSPDEWDFVVKLDADLELPNDYFKRMLAEFSRNPQLGIASGVYLEEQQGNWSAIKMPAYHAAGASKIVRRPCFLDIGGFPRSPGWDTADEIKAQARGWQTAHFPEIEFKHLRPEGSAIGLLRTARTHGEMYYACGGGTIFLIAKALRKAIAGKPPLAAAVALVYGYLRAAWQRQPRLVDAREANAYRKLLNRQLTGQLGRFMPFLRVN